MTRPTVEEVQRRYAAAAVAVGAGGCCGGGPAAEDACGCCQGAPQTGDASGCCDGAPAADDACGCTATAGAGFGLALYDADDRGALPDAAALASLGCGVPTAVADLRPGEVVLDLGSGGGIDVLLSARRVGPTGFVYGVDMTPEMLTLARRNAATAGIDNVAFLEGRIEALPLPDASVDVIVSNCVINLSVDKPAVLAEMARVLRPGGRIGISDVVAEDHLSASERAERGSFVGCIAGALSFQEYRDGLAAVGFVAVEVVPTHEVADGMHAAIVHAERPAT
jgi:arsenite methyltransferase